MNVFPFHDLPGRHSTFYRLLDWYVPIHCPMIASAAVVQAHVLRELEEHPCLSVLCVQSLDYHMADTISREQVDQQHLMMVRMAWHPWNWEIDWPRRVDLDLDLTCWNRLVPRGKTVSSHRPTILDLPMGVYRNREGDDRHHLLTMQAFVDSWVLADQTDWEASETSRHCSLTPRLDHHQVLRLRRWCLMIPRGVA